MVSSGMPPGCVPVSFLPGPLRRRHDRPSFRGFEDPGLCMPLAMSAGSFSNPFSRDSCRALTPSGELLRGKWFLRDFIISHFSLKKTLPTRSRVVFEAGTRFELVIFGL